LKILFYIGKILFPSNIFHYMNRIISKFYNCFFLKLDLGIALGKLQIYLHLIDVKNKRRGVISNTPVP
jgi:hypothetical protein